MTTISTWFDSPTIDRNQFRVLHVEYEEELSTPYEVRVDLAGAPGARLEDVETIGNPGALVIERDGVEIRRVTGVITRVAGSLHEESGSLRWRITSRPRMEGLSLTTSTEVVQDATVPEILCDRLSRIGLQRDRDFELSLAAEYAAREFVVQYRETDLCFVNRLLEHEGITYYFRMTENGELMVLSDANEAIKATAPIQARFRPRGERSEVFELSTDIRAIPNRVALRDYNYRTPKVSLDSESTMPGRSGTTYEFGNHAKTQLEVQHLATVRSQEIGARRRIFTGHSSLPQLSAGSHLQLEGHPIGELELLVVSVSHRLNQADWGSAESASMAYENQFTAIPLATPFRPIRRTPKPLVAGVISGIVEAAQEGQYAELDGDGRYHIRFLFDRRDVPRGKASRPMRMAQPHAGPGYGFHFPLRDGVEVLLSCVEGDPDRPIIAGAVPNPTTPTTVSERNAPRNVIRTGGGTEINIDDSEGSERFKITVPFGETLLQLGAPNDPTPGAALKTNQNIALASGAGMSLDDRVEIRGHAPRIDLRADNTAILSSGTQTAIGSDAETVITAPIVDRRANINVTTSFAIQSSISHGIAVLQGASSVSVGSDGIVVVSAPMVVLKADAVKVMGSAAVDVNAPTVKVEGSNVHVAGGEVTVTGSLIKLNA
jgi:type VI secretion system secreted protein VgrG